MSGFQSLNLKEGDAAARGAASLRSLGEDAIQALTSVMDRLRSIASRASLETAAERGGEAGLTGEAAVSISFASLSNGTAFSCHCGDKRSCFLTKTER